MHNKHMKLIDAVNNAPTDRIHERNNCFLQGWREGVRDAGKTVDLIAADITQFNRGFENRPMCAGVFIEWKPEGKKEIT